MREQYIMLCRVGLSQPDSEEGYFCKESKHKLNQLSQDPL